MGFLQEGCCRTIQNVRKLTYANQCDAERINVCGLGHSGISYPRGYSRPPSHRLFSSYGDPVWYGWAQVKYFFGRVKIKFAIDPSTSCDNTFPEL